MDFNALAGWGGLVAGVWLLWGPRAAGYALLFMGGYHIAGLLRTALRNPFK